MNEQILNKASQLPEEPGVYIFKDEKNAIIYVGKAKKLKRRVLSYFRESTWSQNEKARLIAEESEDLDFIMVTSEREALLLEANLIFSKKPKYNVFLKDSRTYPYIYISAEEYPYIAITRTKELEGTYFGPYTSAGLVRKLLEFLQKVFKIRTCTYDLGRIKRPCFLYHLKMCSAPCVEKVSPEEYQEQLSALTEFLEGDTIKVREALLKRMTVLSEALQFERAAEIRDILSSMDDLYAFQGVEAPLDLKADILAVSAGLAALLQVRGGMLLGKLVFDFPDGTPMDFITQFYYAKKNRIPKSLIVTGLKKKDVRQFRRDFDYIGDPRDEQEERLLSIAFKNIDEELKIRLNAAHSLRQAQQILGLKRFPSRIEGIDISHTQGLYTVASVVVFDNGKPNKSEYRRYRISELEEPNDFEAMATVVKRRYTKYPLPDLLLIDGGEPQLRAVEKAFAEIGIEEYEIVGLAKEFNELVFLDNRDRVRLKEEHPVLRMIISIDNEAHRFAVNYHRVLRERRFLTSKIDDIPGIGPKRKKALLKAFGSIKGISKASEDDLRSVLKNSKAVEAVTRWASEKSGD
ncbi:excinuclease ABC subunit C [Mesotoga sp. Brook.08.YT.4.2.5.2.]|uniref:excinuclease ABC subunit UvrC n=1 Tax=unclassified Mesotoga TaxID=1184398 RepID=UPI000D9E8FDF|nr:MULTISPECIES: excinuclease ABC subunit UvrC [unclassified Mesotoga]PXF34513.1 excinuclease ABC subunit C [Mesotoga sp. SC_NapDC]RAO96657.1 excinuclease ABC subunit C [Mesotoga sp. Brook.08.YT.4.2.5.4.]RDI93046.1 excinuclease ABC subunit C [Mesotoga sp. Brook.08.YT.4.2.5.2.]